MQPASDDPWASYGRTVVEIMRPKEGTLTIRSAPEADPGRWPWPTGEPVHILTAWDPGPARPGPAINRARQAALEDDLRPLGVAMVAAVGVDPVTGHREEGVAVRGVAESVILTLGARYGQDAIFAWTPTAWSIVGCRDGRRLTSGWALGRAGANGLGLHTDIERADAIRAGSTTDRPIDRSTDRRIDGSTGSRAAVRRTTPLRWGSATMAA